MKSKIILTITLVITLLFGSCKNYLDEINKTGKTEDLVYSNETAINGLVGACYAYNRVWYGRESGFGLSEGGTDLWYNGYDNKQGDLVTYKNVIADPASDPVNNNSCLDEYWEAFYAGVNVCNTAEKYIKAASFLTSTKKKTLLSEVYFLRAFYYWHMVETWGPVQINLEPITEANTTATRNSVDEVYTQMFKDVKFAIDSLDPGTAPSSRVSYWAAKAFRARLGLYYASEYGKTEYYAQAAQDAKDVIGCPGKILYDKFSDNWLMANSSTTTNKEFIWAIDYFGTIGDASSYNFLPPRMKLNTSNNTPLDWTAIISRRTPGQASGGGNTMHVLCTPVWYSQTDATHGASLADVLTRYVGPQLYYNSTNDTTKTNAATNTVDVGYFYAQYAMGYCRYAPTRYLLELYDETKDQRFNGTFRTAWYKYPSVVPQYYYKNKAKCKYPKMSTGTNTDTVLYWSKKPLSASQIAWATGRYKYYDINWTFNGETPIGGSLANSADRMFAMLRKFEDTDSKITASTSFNDYFSYKDVPVFRISEMYLIAAEALMGTDPSQAVTLVNQLRAKRAIAGQDLSVASVDLNFILAERAREFAGENIRWFDLKRTKTLETQIAHNTKAAPFFDKTKHYLRPIPSSQMNAVTNKTSGEQPGGFWQNPGY